MGFWGDIGQVGSDLFTGRWTGGQTNLATDNWTPVAELGGAAAATAWCQAYGRAPGPALFGTEAAVAGGEAAAAGVGSLDSLAIGGGVGMADAGTLGLGAETIPAGAEFATLNTGGTVPGLGDVMSAPAGPVTGDLASITGGAPVDAGITTGPNAVSAGGVPAAGSPPGNWYDSIVNSVTHPTLGGVAQAAGVGASAIGLGSALFRGNPNSAAADKLTNIGGFGTAVAGTQTATGQALQSYLLSGTLPPSMVAGVQQYVTGQKAKITAGYAARGMPTQPGSNSALDADLARVEQDALVMTGKLEQQLFDAGTGAVNAGLTAAQLSEGAYKTLSDIDQSNKKAYTDAMTQFAASLVPKSNYNINFGGNKTAAA